MSNVWAVDDVPTPRDALAKYGGAWSADSSTHTAVSELVASLRLAVDEIDALTRERDGYANDSWQKNLENIALKAEAERLRPAAEAWEAWREYDELIARMPLTRDTEQEQTVQDAATKKSTAYARARAAKSDALAHEAALKSAQARGDA